MIVVPARGGVLPAVLPLAYEMAVPCSEARMTDGKGGF